MAANIAILIDAENVDPSFANQILSYARSLGEVTIREIYGAGIALNEWADPILENTIHTNFTLRPNKYKNSSDIALTIGAMELLSASRATEDKKVDAVIIASSDSDFSPLAFHLRAAGIDVIGMGEPGRINPMWPKACTEFVTLSPGQPLVRKRETAPQFAPPFVQPVDETPSGQPALPSEQFVEDAALAQPDEETKPAEEKKKNETVKIAHSHSARVQLIRSFITTQLAAHDGRMKSGELFKALASIPDYKFDQQRSRRKPLDYLEKQYAAWFMLTPGENGSYWISARHATISDEQPILNTVKEQPAVSTESEQSAVTVKSELPVTVDEQPDAKKDTESLPDDPRVALIETGMPIQDAGRVTEILSDSKNLFAAYNGLSKAFGRKQGSQYYQLIKARFTAAPAPTHQEKAAGKPTDEETEERPIQDTPDQPEEVNEATLEQFLLDQGIAADRAATVSSIINSSANLRIAYNEMRKAFGAADGRDYLSLVKEFRTRIV